VLDGSDLLQLLLKMLKMVLLLPLVVKMTLLQEVKRCQCGLARPRELRPLLELEWRSSENSARLEAVRWHLTRWCWGCWCCWCWCWCCSCRVDLSEGI
jgi:hypothetical protein